MGSQYLPDQCASSEISAGLPPALARSRPPLPVVGCAQASLANRLVKQLDAPGQRVREFSAGLGYNERP